MDNEIEVYINLHVYLYLLRYLAPVCEIPQQIFSMKLIITRIKFQIYVIKCYKSFKHAVRLIKSALNYNMAYMYIKVGFVTLLNIFFNEIYKLI